MEHHAGVDKEATCALLGSKALPVEQRGLLRSILAGSVRLGERLCKAGLWESPMCPFLRHGGGIARTLLLAVSSLGAPSGSRGHSLRASARAFASLHVGVWYLHAHVARDTLRT